MKRAFTLIGFIIPIFILSMNITGCYDPESPESDKPGTPAYDAVIELNKLSISDTITEGSDASSQTFTIYNSGSDTLSYTISDDVNWINCSPTSGASLGETDSITVDFVTSLLSAGDYPGVITIRDINSNNSSTIDVSLSVVPDENPIIVLEPSSLSRTITQGTNALSQSFSVRNSGTGTLEYTISDNVNWLSCTTTSGSSNGESDTITINYSTSSLTTGSYIGTITVSDNDAANSPMTIIVTLIVEPVPIPTISLSTDSITVYTFYGDNLPSQTFTVSNIGTGTLSYSISDNSSWLSCSPTNGTSTTETDVITIDYTTTSLAIGTYTGYIQIMDGNANNSPQYIEVNLTVESPPQAYISLDSYNITQTIIQGENAAAQSFSIENTGDGFLPYVISDNVTWLSCSPNSGTVSNETDAITVNYVASGLSAGTYNATIEIDNSSMIFPGEVIAVNAPQSINVTLIVNPPITPPDIDRVFDIEIEEFYNGNGDGVANVGEDIRLEFKVENNGGETAYNVESGLFRYSSDLSYCYVYQVTDSLSDIGPDGDWSRASHIFEVIGVPSDNYLDFACTVNWEDADGNSYSESFDADDGLRVRIYP